MRDCRQKQLMVVLVSVIAVVIISGCAIKHSDVMLFGTNTKYGLSIAMDQPENTPHINVGYKRQEFVWMPLVANGADSVIQTKVATANAQDLKYIGKEPTGKEDTYSVLASFGANFKASGAAGGGGIAQYFATGMAARKLAEVGGASLVQASSIDLTPQKTELTPEDMAVIQDTINEKNKKADKIMQKVAPDGKFDPNILADLAKKAGLADAWAKKFDSAENLEKALKTYDNSKVDQLYRALEE
ncbi:MAG: hypothetical protein HZA47_01135 [Planctomycetes bacterium]|uniref:hypothetical protein n=1 Tax=Candidatus Wunengus sp. YC65 TaxID=3367701 RepID=UPI001DEA682A|nr:hypothetical protein [Planctomycetota bacterium]